MDGLRGRLMDPALFKVFAEQFTGEWNRLQAEAGATSARLLKSIAWWAPSPTESRHSASPRS
jgi:hypothetical protein